MKKLFSIPLVVLMLAGCNDDDHVHDAVVITKTDPAQADTAKKSIKAYVQNKIGAARLTIHYHSPAVRDRIIWGGLVPYDRVWVTGAHTLPALKAIRILLLTAGRYPLVNTPFLPSPEEMNGQLSSIRTGINTWPMSISNRMTCCD
jgi:hypothetical protein